MSYKQMASMNYFDSDNITISMFVPEGSMGNTSNIKIH